MDYVVEEADGTYSLAISETRPWDGGQGPIDQLTAAEGRAVRVLLHAFHLPAGEVTEVLPIVRSALDGVGLRRRHPGSPRHDWASDTPIGRIL